MRVHYLSILGYYVLICNSIGDSSGAVNRGENKEQKIVGDGSQTDSQKIQDSEASQATPTEPQIQQAGQIETQVEAQGERETREVHDAQQTQAQEAQEVQAQEAQEAQAQEVQGSQAQEAQEVQVQEAQEALKQDTEVLEPQASILNAEKDQSPLKRDLLSIPIYLQVSD